MPDSRETILKNVRRSLPQASEAPSMQEDWITFPDRYAQFSAVLESVGGTPAIAKDAADLNHVLGANPLFSAAQKRCSLVEGVQGNVDLSQITDPHDLHDVDFAVLPGHFAVAENGAVWITDEHTPQRVIYFLPQHLALVIRSVDIVDNLHQAYDRISLGQPGFGAFISGPSKTADIEQSLVIGAHGPRSMMVIFLES